MVLCDEGQKVIGFNADALRTLGIEVAGHMDLLKGATLIDIVPQLSNPAIMSAVLRKEGAVITPGKPSLQLDCESSSNLTRVESHSSAAPAPSISYRWMRLVSEEYGRGLALQTLVMADIAPECRDKYLPSPKTAGVYETDILATNSPELRRFRATRLPERANSGVQERIGMDQAEDTASALSATTDQAESEKSKSSGSESLSREIEFRMSVGKQLPSSILRLYIVTMSVLIIIAVLISKFPCEKAI